VQGHEKPAGCFAALVDELELNAPTVLVVEDVHWADEATLDVLTMVGRRAESVPALTLVTYRVDGLASNASLRETIGELGAGAGVSRVGLAPLSAAAVEELAEPHGINGTALHLRTAGTRSSSARCCRRPASRSRPPSVTRCSRAWRRAWPPESSSRAQHHRLPPRAGAARRRGVGAQRAAAAGAHREAAAQYMRALRFARSLGAAERAAMQVRLSEECHMTADFDEAIGSLEAALADYRSIDEPLREGDVLRKLSATVYCMGGGSARADAASQAAIEILETLPPSSELAMAYETMASRHMNAERAAQTYAWGARAAALAEQFGDMSHRVVSLNDIGTIEYLHGLDSGREKLEQSLALAQENGYEDDAERAYLHLSWVSVRNREYDRAAAYVREGTAYCIARDLDLHRIYLDTHWGRAELDLGRWDAAGESVTRVIADRRRAPDALVPALSTLGLLRARRGDSAAWEPLDAARTLCEGGELQRFGPATIARAEVLWLQGRLNEIEDETAATFALALDRGASWVVGEIAIWRWRAGVVDDLPAGAAAEPYALSVAGKGSAAAARWGEFGCPYEAALALADTGEEDALRRALDDLGALGARPAAATVMRPRRPRRPTRTAPADPRQPRRAHRPRA
jgi:tetratricopeptide (TPR) repeat protein